eukprot:TRINITY_DN2167_c0_g2_i2.p1 TRINITY_DN2167_c0_g2~~TRINITY_DN2167_c0_g2_i2.p1  ORF type:complete len:101 (+),score=9.50 TRINITY_DN2167_c0_g2_i2:95-397(+)
MMKENLCYSKPILDYNQGSIPPLMKMKKITHLGMVRKLVFSEYPSECHHIGEGDKGSDFLVKGLLLQSVKRGLCNRLNNGTIFSITKKKKSEPTTRCSLE